MPSSKQFRWVCVILGVLAGLFLAQVEHSAVQPVEAAGMALTPPMGWISWNVFRCDVNEQIVRQTAEAMGRSGMRDAGYRYVVIDDCWASGRDADGNLVVDQDRFPSGMKAIGDYIHNRGLKFGLYSARGRLTCQHRPGSLGYETKDAALFASWGVDYLKYDNCDGGLDVRQDYVAMRDALRATGRPIVFSIASWAFQEWHPSVGQLSRTTHDIQDRWDAVINIFDRNATYAGFARPGYFNDPDMLMVGGTAMNETEYRAQFSLWAISAAPLMAGNDVRQMPTEIRDILTNPEVIAVNQDSLGLQARKVAEPAPGLQVWAKRLRKDGNVAVALFNRTDSPATITVNWRDLKLESANATVRDLWEKRQLGSFTDQFSASVPSHGVVLLRVTKSGSGSPQKPERTAPPAEPESAKDSKPTQKSQPAASAASSGAVAGTALTLTDVNIRAEPRSTARVVASVATDTTLSVEARSAEGNWLLVRTTGGKRGWARGNQLKLNGLSAEGLPVSSDTF